MRFAKRPDCGKPLNSQSCMKDAAKESWGTPLRGVLALSQPLSSLVRQVVIGDEHLAVPLFGAAARRVDDLDGHNPPTAEQLSHLGMIVQGEQKFATDFVQALFELGEVLVAEVVAVKLSPPVRRVHIEAGGGGVVPFQDLLVG